jgi:hypothetical protein
VTNLDQDKPGPSNGKMINLPTPQSKRQDAIDVSALPS